MQSVQVKFWDGLQGIQGIQEASGTPSSVGLQGLQSLTAYRCQAVWLDNNTPFAESNISAFTTLAAGSITLQLHNITRQGYNYVVHYLVTSTYALSNAVLSINGGQVFQGTIQGNTITFNVSGLDAGTAYLYTVTAEDIYQESATVMGTLTTTVVNEINMYYDSRTENSVTFDLSYIHDYAFQNGYVEYWDSTQDPSTDQAQGYDFFDDGDTQCTVGGLTAETTYKFRAAMCVRNNGVDTYVYSSVITKATAEHDFTRDFFTINNEDSVANDIYLRESTTHSAITHYITVMVSTDGGSTWTSKKSQESGNGVLLGSLRVGGKMLVKFNGSFAIESGANYAFNTFNATGKFSVSGNITSLTNSAPMFNQTMPSCAFYALFSGATTLISADKLYLGGYTSVSDNAMNSMFFRCTSLEKAPNFGGLDSVGKKSLYGMFNGCTSLVTAPDLSKIAHVNDMGISQMYSGCTSLVSAVAPTVTWSTYNAYRWLYNVAASGVVFADSSISSTIATDDESGCPTGWSVQTI